MQGYLFSKGKIQDVNLSLADLKAHMAGSRASESISVSIDVALIALYQLSR